MRVAIGFLCILLVLYVSRAAYVLPHLASPPGSAFIALAIGAFTITTLIVWKITKGKNWARWLFVVIFIISGGPDFFALPAVFQRNLTLGFLSAFELLVQVSAAVLLFLPSSSRWFSLAPVSGNHAPSQV